MLFGIKTMFFWTGPGSAAVRHGKQEQMATAASPQASPLCTDRQKEGWKAMMHIRPSGRELWLEGREEHLPGNRCAGDSCAN